MPVVSRVRCAAAGLIAIVASATGALSQAYPTRPITFVVSFAPGGLSDVPGRLLAAEMQTRIGQSIIVENRPGASGVTGASSVLRAEPDGYTLLVNALADVQNLHYLSVPYNAIDDFALIGLIADGPPLVLVVNAGQPWKTLAELIADARANPTRISFGSSGPATSPAIAITQLNALAGTTIADVPYRGSGQAATAVLSGEVQGSFAFYTNARPFAADGKVRPLGIATKERFVLWPELLTMSEQGFANFEHKGFVGLAAPGKTPRAIVDVLNKHLNESLNAPSVRGKLEALGMTVPKENTPESFAAFMRREVASQAELARLSGHRK